MPRGVLAKAAQQSQRRFGHFGDIALGLFTVSEGLGYRTLGRRIVCEGSQARKSGRKEASKRSAHCVVIGSSVESIRHGPCVDAYRPQETCDRDPDVSVCHRRRAGAIALS
jgi:hypothetical protein